MIEPPRDVGPDGRGFGRALAAVVAVALVVGVAVVAVNAAADRAGTPAAAPDSTEAPFPSDRSGPVGLDTLPPVVAAPLPFPGGAVAPARYATDLLGIPIEFTIGEATRLRTARPGTILLTPGGTAVNSLDGEPHVQFLRVAGWNTRDEAADRLFRGVGGIAADDVERWIADNDVIVDRRARMVVDGRDTRVFDLRVDPASPLGDRICSPAARPCFWFASVAEDQMARAAIRLDHTLAGPMSIRLWLISIEGEHPVLVEAAAVAGDDAWLDGFEATTIATMTIGATRTELLAGAGTGVPPVTS